jgi:hypothetical protein
MEKQKKEIEIAAFSPSDQDKFKVYVTKNDWVYNGWNDYKGLERKNRQGHWTKRMDFINQSHKILYALNAAMTFPVSREVYSSSESLLGGQSDDKTGWGLSFVLS